jgi:hypothetical protein
MSLVASLAALAAILGAGAGAATAGARPDFGPPGSGIQPGVRTQTADTFCTANFVFYDAAGHIYLGQAAHCARQALPKEAVQPNGCTFGSHPLGTPVKFGDAGVSGTLVYSSWLAMQRNGETDANACKDNDFALVEVPDYARDQVNPSMPLVGGPTGLNTTGTVFGDPVVGYGNSPTRQNLEDAKSKQTVAVGTIDGGWAHLIYPVNPGIPGDSGGPYLDPAGRALGSLATLVLFPAPASNNIVDIAHALDYARRFSGINGLDLAIGTEKFEGPSVLSPLLNQVVPRPKGQGQLRPNPR